MMKTNYFNMNIYNPQYLIQKILVFSLILSFSINAYTQTDSCKAQLVAENGIVSKKAGQNGTSYEMSLENLGSKTGNFRISILNVDEVQNSGHSIISLKGEVFPMNKRESLTNNLDKKINSNYLITLNSGERFEFKVELIPESGAKIGSKNITEVEVTSDDCSNFIVTKLLRTEIEKKEIKNN